MHPVRIAIDGLDRLSGAFDAEKIYSLCRIISNFPSPKMHAPRVPVCHVETSGTGV